MKRVFRPFWTYDVEKTEHWLSTMAMQGFHLVKVNTVASLFYFKQNLPQKTTYFIVFEKGVTLSTRLVNEGWKEIFKARSWYIVENAKASEEINALPSREGIINHNRNKLYLFTGILIYILFTLLMQLFFLVITWSKNAPITIEKSPMWIVTIAFGIIAFVWPLYAVVKLYKTNKLLDKSGFKLNYKTSKRYGQEKNLKKTEKVIKKRRPGWFYSPDKLENWLESMEASGYNLLHVNRIGTFAFKKGDARKVKYCADYQNTRTHSYFEIHQEAGWRLMYRSNGWLSKWAIWSQVYWEDEERAQFYSDEVSLLKHARRVMITHLSIFVPLIIMYILLLAQNFNNMLIRENALPINMSQIVISLVIIEFSIFSLKALFYYKRVKKELSGT